MDESKYSDYDGEQEMYDDGREKKQKKKIEKQISGNERKREKNRRKGERADGEGKTKQMVYNWYNKHIDII